MPLPSLSKLLVAALLLSAQTRLAAQAPPASFSTEVSRTASDKVTVDFVHHPIRHANFEVLLVAANGSIASHTPLPPRTYFGTVQGHPGAIACGWLRPDGTLFARVAFEDGVEWVSTGGNASVRGNTTWQPDWPTTLVPAGGAGNTVHAVETGVDLTNRQLVASGGTPDLAVGMAEYAVMSSNYVFLRDAAILHRVGRIVIRMAASNDPYEAPSSVTTNTLLDEVKNQWNNALPAGSNHRVALVARTSVNGGLAWVGVIGDSSNRYSSNNSDSNGDFSVVWRHEVGHNWGSSHYEGGGRPEGPTIMSDNSLPRFSSPELAKIIAHRNSRLGFLQAIPSYPFPLPPRANTERVWFSGTNTAIDVLANDSDSNGDAISILSFDATCSRGGAVTRLVGAGPGGRDLLNYTPHPEFQNGTGFFRYRIADATGRSATGYVMLRPSADSFEPLHHWALDETSGSTAFNSSSGPDGTHANSPSVNQPGATPVTGRGVTYNGTNQSTGIPALGLTGNTYTFTAWIRRSGSQATDAPVFYTRNSNSSGASYTGLYLNSNNLRVRWNGAQFTPSPTLSVPNNAWCLAAFSVSPTQVAVHLRTASGLTTSTHNTTISSATFANPFLIARSQPTSGSPLYFGGTIDDVRIYPGVLSATQINALYTQAASPPDFAIVNPEPGQSVNPQGTRFIAGSTQSSELLRSVEFHDPASTYSFGTAATAPFALTVDSLDPGPAILGARASYGDWGYRIEAPQISYQVLETSRPVVTLTASGLPSFGGSGTRFVFRRDSTSGSLEVPFTLSGTAVRNSDYTIPGNSIVFPNGQSQVTLDLTPAAAPSSPGEKSATLSLTETAAFVIESPSSATVVFADSVRSAASGNWNLASVWNNSQPAPATGTQGTGPDYIVMGGHVVGSHDQASNSQGMVARSIRVSNNGRLELSRPHNGTLVNATYDIPRVTLDSGGTLRFTASVGSSGHNIAAPVEALGNATIQLSGGSYDQFADLTGPVSGTGNLTLQSITNAGAVTANIRAFSILSAGNPYSGNWSIEHTPTGDDFGAIRAAAVNALGTGGVTVLRRSQLINAQSGGLDSLSFITLSGQTSSLLLNQPTQAPKAALTLSSSTAEVVVGNATSTLGSLAGTNGSIRGAASGSTLALHQTQNGAYAGAIGQNLRLRKQGPARLAITGTIHTGTAVELQNGRLSPGASPRTLASLAQSGGILELPGAAASPGTPRLTVTGTASFTGGTIEIAFPTTPQTGVTYRIVAYGSLTGVPEITLTHPGPQTLLAVVDPGTGTDSTVTAIFREPVQLTVLSSDPLRGEAGGGGIFPTNTGAPITATAAPGWRFINWSGTGIADPSSPSTTVLMDAPKTVTANFDRPRSIWTEPLTGGSWSDAANWNVPPDFTADEWLDFSTLDLTAANTNTLDGHRTAGGLRFADLPNASHDWTIAPGSGGNLTLATTTGLPPETEVPNRSATISAALAGNQGLAKTGNGTLVLNHPANTLTGPISVESGILQIRDGATNTPTVFDSADGRPLTIGAGATLDLPRLHAFTVQTVTWSLPPITLGNGATLRFRASTGSNTHQLSSPLTIAGNVTLNNNGGAYAQDIDLTGSLAGSGVIQYLATSASGSSTTTRTLTLSNPAATFAGDWLVDYTAATSDDFVALRPAAPGALGTGSVTLDRRARLIAGAANSLDSLTGITLLKPTSFADLHPHGWNQPSATLAIQDGTVDAGNSTVTVGSLSQSGGVLRISLAGENPAPVQVTGNATFTGGAIQLTITGDPSGKTFEALRYQGTLAGLPTISFPGYSRGTPNISFGSGTNDVITVTFPAETAATLVWRGDNATNPNHWDLTTTVNWTNDGTPDTYLTGDSVVFNDGAASFTPSLQGAIHAATVTFDHGANDYTLSGPGSLATASLVKQGTGTTTISSANTFTGPVAIHAGRLRLANAAALGDSIDGAKTVTIRPGGQLDLNAFNNTAPSRSYTLHLAGDGPDPSGALVNTGSGISSNAGILHLALSANTTIGGSGRFDIGWVNGNPAQGTLTGNGHVLTKTGANQIMLRGDASATPITIIVAQGVLGAENHDASLGGGTGQVTVRDGAALGVWGARTLATPVTLESGATLRALGGGAATWAGPVTLAGNATVDLSGEAKTISGPVSGNGSLTKSGSHTLTLTAPFSYPGDTRIDQGALAITSASLADTADLHIAASATIHLDFTGTDTIRSLIIGATPQAPGVYGAIGSGAANETASITGSGTLTVAPEPRDAYSSWEDTNGIPGSGPLADPDNDGIPNAIEFVIGGIPAGPGSDSSQFLPTASRDDTHLIFAFRRSSASAACQPTVEYTSDLTLWNTATPGHDGVLIEEQPDAHAPGLDQVIIRIPLTLAIDGKLLARLSIRIPPSD